MSAFARALARFLVPAALLAAPGGAQDLPYESLATALLRDLGRGDARPETLDLHELLSERFLRVSAGVYDVHFPLESVASEKDVDDYRRVVLALLAAQDRWLDWLEPGVADERTLSRARKDRRVLARWVEGWSPRAVARGVAGGARDMLEVLDARESVREAARRYADYLARGTALGLDRGTASRETIVLMPDRVRMVQMCALGGWIHPQHRGVFWQPGIATWTHCRIDDVKVLATRYAMPRTPGDYASGVRMDERNPTGLEQQIVQLATGSMLASTFGDAMPPSLAGGLAVNLVIDLYGECDTRADGDLRARQTSAREVFVPGGNPEGGVLPPNLADSRWRSEQGADRFVAALKRAMPRGRGPVRFVLEDDRGRPGFEVRPPFLGAPAALASPPPEAYAGDRLEFLRAYRTCFLHWLRERGTGSTSSAPRAFADLLRLLARGAVEGLEAALAEVYGMPLSDPDPDESDLEGRFLAWLARRR